MSPPVEKKRKPRATLVRDFSGIDQFTANDVLGWITDSWNRKNTNRSVRPEPTQEVAERIYARLQCYSDAYYILSEQCQPWFVPLDQGKVLHIKDYVNDSRRLCGSFNTKHIAKWLYKETRVGNLGLCGGYVGTDGNGKDKWLMIVDIDNLDLSFQEQVIKSLGKTILVRTPKGGLHAYYLSSQKVGNLFTWNGIDIKGARGYVVAASSKIQSGNNPGEYLYDVENELFSWTVPYLPDDWMGRLSDIAGERNKVEPVGLMEVTSSKKKEEGDSIPTPHVLSSGRVPVGSRSNWLIRVAGREYHRCSSESDLFNRLCRIKNDMCDEPESFSDNEIDNIVGYIFKREVTNPKKKEEGDSIPTPHNSGPTPYETIFFSTLSALPDFMVSLDDVARVYQFALEKKGMQFTKPISPVAVGRLLKSFGYSSKQIRLGKHGRKSGCDMKVTRWNVDPSSIPVACERLVTHRSKPQVTQPVPEQSNKKAPSCPPNVPVAPTPVQTKRTPGRAIPALRLIPLWPEYEEVEPLPLARTG